MMVKTFSTEINTLKAKFRPNFQNFRYRGHFFGNRLFRDVIDRFIVQSHQIDVPGRRLLISFLLKYATFRRRRLVVIPRKVIRNSTETVFVAIMTNQTRTQTYRSRKKIMITAAYMCRCHRTVNNIILKPIIPLAQSALKIELQSAHILQP